MLRRPHSLYLLLTIPAFTAISTLWPCNPVLAKDLRQVFRAAEGFSIFLPDNWVRVPEKAVSERFSPFADAKPDSVPGMPYAFQARGSEAWFTPPVLMIMIDYSGRMPESEVTDRAFREEKMKEGADETTSELQRHGVKEVDVVGEHGTRYDADKHILWSRTTTRGENDETTSIFVATILTQKGFIQLTFLPDSSEIERQQALFVAIAEGAKLDESLAYTDQPEAVSYTHLRAHET